ncbi:photosynthetic reaction center subunit H [Rhodovulum sulfidophilum]|uniref:Photosynthetic reaction center subunit H n=1 Tax=Rhodovulum sulfidophilum TaxID=35806 RepID=A0ABS1RTK2_RHOSU|nr:photosynthetic reaction center subunit H [Rhodovulum sulfidophilum]MBL3559880.1 photosynthetic reaction center subunit H [Rhodovulum sulfidophilum]MBL3563707.1 photosynthetic reaction center subunit H [Rhodovulum sulfidophilum]MBL3573824.1 photosynthetic reaction center subunit H [Rhodovulum sulfidophilum]MBL3609419.1 photosynthetic reaction center subunit H [Rhodovulum sulfidophilum]MCE8417886.1 photosynthetic reaction center subunit H [Rhodovulum sulfidophilum]
MVNAFFGNFDIASLAIWSFWLFFAGLIFYLQRMNMHEGYPLEDEVGNAAPNQGMFPLPAAKTFKLPHGQGEKTVPDMQTDPRNADLALQKVTKSNGYPLEPTGDPMVDGVGPAAWCARKDEPELDGRGHPKIQPLSVLKTFKVSAGRDPRGMPVIAGDGEAVGTIVDMWVDEPEQLVRYLELELDDAHGGGRRLLPMQLAKIGWFKPEVSVHSIYGKHFAAVPTIKSAKQITKLEEDKVCAYYAGGKLYADPAERLEPQF